MADKEEAPSKWKIPEGEFCVYGTVSAYSTSFPSIPTPSHRIWLIAVKVYAHPDKADALEAVYAETTRLAQLEAGCIYYCIGRDADDPSIFQFFERYASKQAFDNHNSQPIIRKLLDVDKYIKDVTATFVKPIGPASS
jgi:quinol monooxygenase YgiN